MPLRPVDGMPGRESKTPVPASNADRGLSRHLSGACCGALLWTAHCGQKLRIWVDFSGRRPYCLQRAPATPMSLLRQRYAQPSGPRVRSALISASVENLGSQRTPHFPPVWIGESGLYWRARAISLEAGRRRWPDGRRWSAGRSRSGRRTLCEKPQIWVDITGRDA